jgi:glycosyltransferase involved in cell wall biosynthesis
MISSPLHAIVAIITRTKNRPLLLGRALDSVLGQSCADWVHVIVNDGGDAAAVDAAVNARRPHYGERVGVHHLPASGGMESASNAGLGLSRSRYVVILDDDDSWHPDFLRKSLAAMQNCPLPKVRGIVCHSVRVDERIGADGKIHEISRAPFNDWLRAIEIPRLCASNTFPPVSFLFERALTDDVGGFDPDLPVLGDWDFNLRVALAAEIMVLPESLAYYHHRTDDQSVYGNTLTAQRAKHEICRSYIINKWARKEYADGRFSVAQAMAFCELNRETYRFSARENRKHDAASRS